MARTPHLSRREFVTVTAGALGTIMVATIGIPAVGYALGPGLKVTKVEAWVPVGKVSDFPVDEPTLVNFTRTKVNGWEKTVNSYGVFVIKPSDGEIYALSSTCTHLSCRVKWVDTDQLYECPCHDAAFDINGAVIAGPPPRPLDAYENKVEEGILYVHYLEG